MTDSKDKFCCSDKMNMYELCAKCYQAFFSDPDFLPDWLAKDEYLDGVSPKFAICECGSEASGGTTHSHWCPKGEK